MAALNPLMMQRPGGSDSMGIVDPRGVQRSRSAALQTLMEPNLERKRTQEGERRSGRCHSREIVCLTEGPTCQFGKFVNRNIACFKNREHIPVNTMLTVNRNMAPTTLTE